MSPLVNVPLQKAHFLKLQMSVEEEYRCIFGFLATSYTMTMAS